MLLSGAYRLWECRAGGNHLSQRGVCLLEQVSKEDIQKVVTEKGRMPILALGDTRENLTVPVTTSKDICILLRCR